MTDNGIDSMFSYNLVGFKGGTGIINDGAGVVSLPARVRGIEAYGVLNHRFFYTVKVWHPKLKATLRTVAVAGATEVAFEIAK